MFLSLAALIRVATAEHASGVPTDVLDREDGATAAATALLSEDGYAQVAALGQKEAMLTFVRRVLEREGLEVQDEGRLQGMMAFYDGDCAVQSLQALVTELNKGLLKTNCSEPWLTSAKQTEPSSNFLDKGQESTKKGWLSRFFHSKTEKDSNEQAATSFGGLTVGAFAALSEAGYRAVAACGDKSQMALFAHRLLEREGLHVTDEGAFQGMLRYYNGECETQSYSAMLAEMHGVLRRPESCFGGPWLEKVTDGKAGER